MIVSTTLEVRRDALDQTRVTTTTLDRAALVAAGQAVLAIDRFALTANNITYAAYGDDMNYWGFFPADEGFGRVPVWGFADVAASPSDDLPVGTRVYGYFPMASHLVVTPAKIGPKRFVDAAAHRSKLPAVYNTYERVDADPGYTQAREPQQMLLRPLVITSFLIADFLDEKDLFGAQQVLVSSASSKTSLGLAHCLKRLRRKDMQVVGLTSSGNRAFVEATGLYDRVVGYDDIALLAPDAKSVFVDMAGSADIIRRVHGHFRDALVYSCRVGATHWTDMAGRLDVPGARPVFFFAPTQVQKRMTDWGPGGLEQRFGAAWMELLARPSWLKVQDTRGAAAVETAYRDTLAGRVAPDVGLVLGF